MAIREYKFNQTAWFYIGEPVESGGDIVSVVAGNPAFSIGTTNPQPAIGDALYSGDVFLGVVATYTGGDGTFTQGAKASASSGKATILRQANLRRFECGFLTIANDAERERFRLVSNEEVQYTRNRRFRFNVTSPYLRRASSGSYDITDVDEAFDSGSVYILFPEIQVPPIRVLPATDTISTEFQRFHQSPAVSLVFRQAEAMPDNPAWWKITKPSPARYL